MKITILIPCHNEEKAVGKCIESCLNQTRKIDQILVINDGSTDKTLEILKKYNNKIEIVDIPATGNKSFAQEAGLKYVTGDVFITTDGDTLLDKNFALQIEKDFQDQNISAVGGYVRSRKYNWLTAVRAYEYTIGQDLHKRAQSILGFIFVIPGAAGAFRTEVFRKVIKFEHDTITEDLDFTYKLHKGGYKIMFDPKAVIFTQDPFTLKAYAKQMRRWHGGGWQNLMKHLDQGLIEHTGRALELSLLYIEGLVLSAMMFVVPLINIVFALKIFVLYVLTIAVQVIYAATKEKRIDILGVIIYYPLIMYVNAYIFLEQFVTEVLLRRKNMVWFSPERAAI